MNKNEILDRSPLVHPAGAVMAGLKRHQLNKKIKETAKIVEEATEQRNDQINEALKVYKGLGLTKEQIENQLNILDRLEAKNPKAYAKYAQNAQKVLANPTPQNLNDFSQLSANLGVEPPKAQSKKQTSFKKSALGPQNPTPAGATGSALQENDYGTVTKRGVDPKILAAVAACGVVALGALGASNLFGGGFDLKLPDIKLPDLGGGNGGGNTPDFSEYANASVPTTMESNDINKNQCYIPNVDENSEAFKNMIASKDYQSKVKQITEASQQQIDELKTKLNAEVAAKIQSVDAIESASGHQGDSEFRYYMGFQRLPGSNGNGYESVGAFNLRRLNTLENEQMASNQKIDDYFYENVPEYTKDLYAKYDIDLSFGHFKSVMDYIDKDISLKRIQVDNDKDVELYKIIDGKKYEYIITSYNEENLPENTNLNFIKEFFLNDSKHLTLYHDITNGDLKYDYKKSSYYENNDVSMAQKSLDSYYDNIGEPYASQVKQIKNEIDIMQDDYIKQVEQINNNAIKEIANIQTNSLDLASNDDFVALGAQAMDGAKTDKTSLIQSIIENASNIADSAKEVAENLTDDLFQNF